MIIVVAIVVVVIVDIVVPRFYHASLRLDEIDAPNNCCAILKQKREGKREEIGFEQLSFHNFIPVKLMWHYYAFATRTYSQQHQVPPITTTLLRK
eukprot:scaffold1014_cov274-Chaetoceros_neogracile.AAC.6